MAEKERQKQEDHVIRLQQEISFLKRDLFELAQKRKDEAEALKVEMRNKVQEVETKSLD
jgi:hypothetical protein